MAEITYHHDLDWCHICGNRVEGLADVFFSDNAEHQTKNSNYVRICKNCGLEIYNVASKGQEKR